MGSILEIASEFYHLIILKVVLFILPMYCTLWIIGTTCFSRLELWKMNLFSHYFINFSFTFLFIATNIIAMVTLLFYCSSCFHYCSRCCFHLSCVVCSCFYFNYCCRCSFYQYLFYLR